MTNELTTIVLIKVWPLDTAGAEELVIFSSEPWISAAGDTPAHQPAATTFRADTLRLDKTAWRQQDDGLLLLGGVERVGAVNVVLRNQRDEDDYSHPLDPFAAYKWTAARAEIWDAPAGIDSAGRPTLKVALSSFTQRETLRVERFQSSGENDATLTLGFPKTFEAATTPWVVRGWGQSSQALTASPAVRPDDAATRGTGSFTLRWIVQNNVQPSSAQDIHNGQVWRIQCGGSPSANIVLQCNNASNVWQTVATPPPEAATKWKDFHLTYNVSDDKARAYANGTFLAEITVTGGLWASSVSQTLDRTGPEWHCAGWYMLSSVLSDDEIAEDHFRGVVHHPDMVAGFNMEEGGGGVAFDLAGKDEEVTSATWKTSNQGDNRLGGTRLPAVLGQGFGVPLLQWEADKAIFTPGWCFDYYFIRHAMEDGHRLGPGNPNTTSIPRDITAASDKITQVPNPSFSVHQNEFAVAQTIDRSPAGGAGNPTSMTVSRVVIHPILGSAQAPGFIVTSTDQTADESSSFGLTETSREYGQANDQVFFTTRFRPGIEMLVNTDGVLTVSMARQTGMETETALELACTKGGEELTPTTTHEASGSQAWQHGWRVEGEAPHGELLDRVGLSSLAASGDGPVAVTLEADGDIEIYGLRLDATSDDFAIGEAQISDITEVRSERARPTRIEVAYARCWEPAPHEGDLGVDDMLTAEMRSEYRTYNVGTGSDRGRFESSILRDQDAKAQAVALLRIQDGKLFRVDLWAPVPPATIRAARVGRRTTITWPKHPSFTAGLQGVVAGSRSGVESLSVWLWCEPT